MAPLRGNERQQPFTWNRVVANHAAQWNVLKDIIEAPAVPSSYAKTAHGGGSGINLKLGRGWNPLRGLETYIFSNV